MNNLLWDLRYALRSLLRQPLFTLISVLVLALGIGANTAVFSVIDAVLLKPFPYPEPDKLLLLREKNNLFEASSCSYPNYLDWRAAQRSCTDLAIFVRGTYNLSLPSAGETFVPERINAAQVSANYLAILGCRPALGRDFTEKDDVPNGEHVAIITDTLWRRVYDRDRTVVGQTLMLDSEPYTIVGVMPSAYGYPPQAEVLTPLAKLREQSWILRRDNHPGFRVLGRLRGGVSLAAARADFDGIARELERRYPDSNTGQSITVQGLLEATVGDYRRSLYLLLGVVGCVLLIACANVANLQLARANGRTRELAVRAALGASRWRLVRQLLTESVLLAAVGGALGLLLALWAMDTISALSPADEARFHGLRLNWVALLFAGTATIGTGLLVGIWPAWRVSGLATMAAGLREGNARGGTGGAARVRARSLLVIVQVAMAVVLLAGAGLALRSFWRMRTAPLGFRPEGILIVGIALPEVRYKEDEQINAFYDALLGRVRAIPGVEAAAVGVNIPFDDNEWDSGIHVTGTPPYPPGKGPSVEMNYVSPDYFKVMGMPLLSGRDFDSRDKLKSGKTVIVDESLVQKFFPNQDPLGQHLDENQGEDKDAPPLTIIGVVPRTRNDVPEERSFFDRVTQMHVSGAQRPRAISNCYLLVRAAGGNPRALVEPVRQAVLGLDREVPIAQVSTMQENMEKSLVSQRLTMVLLGTFAGLAMVLATLGLYGVMALSVTQRTRELGIRLALGSPRAAVLGLILRQGATLVGLGLAVGLLGAWISGHLLTRVFYGVGGSDLPTMGAVAVLLAAAGLLACWLPARRATRVNPLVALREE